MGKEEDIEKKCLLNFDPDFSWKNLQNRRAAEARRLKYDLDRESYIDEDGYLIRDKYGQEF